MGKETCAEESWSTQPRRRRRKGQHGPESIKCSWKQEGAITKQSCHKQTGNNCSPWTGLLPGSVPDYKPHLLYSSRPGDGGEEESSARELRCLLWEPRGREPPRIRLQGKGEMVSLSANPGATRTDATIMLHALQQRGHVVKPPARVTHTPGHCSSVYSSHPPALQKGREGGETFGAQRCVTQCKFE